MIGASASIGYAENGEDLYAHSNVSPDRDTTYSEVGGKTICKQPSYTDQEQLCNFELTIESLGRDLGDLDLQRGLLTITYGDERAVDVKIPNAYFGTNSTQSEFKLGSDLLGHLDWRPIREVTGPLTFHCDYSAGLTTSRGTLEYRHPRLYSVVRSRFDVTCLPLSVEEVQAQQAAEEAKRLASEKQEAERLRRASPAFKATEAADQIRFAQRLIDDANSALAEERRIGKISGYVDAVRMRRAGQQIANSEQLQATQWRVYKANGGAAASIGDLLKRSN